MVDKQFASVNNVPPEPWTGQDTRDRGMRCLIAPHFLALSNTHRLAAVKKALAEVPGQATTNDAPAGNLFNT